ncbi:MAG: exodeoxyribonuclease VII large subunit [Candidatus Levybacteria bacterium]|nr:exodeoxyribonuclease VII large subunit [Candidatus Levybacteria bacterium]
MNPTLTFTVSEYIATLNAALKTLEAHVVGEVIKVIVSSRGHVYFTLKDRDQDAVIDCVMWGYNYKVNGVQLETGMEVQIGGSSQMYAPTGRISFHTKTLALVGEGALKKAYEKLKKELASQGLLAEERKRPLPAFPNHIGIITSRQGAVIHDFSNNLGTWGFALKFVDSRVEGKEALFDLLQAMKTLRKQNLDVLVIMRGGGSMQSLAAFDNESVVRAIADFPVPVIAAIGHHQDVPLAALVADHAPSTPTAAAHLVSSSWDQAEKTLTASTQTIFTKYRERTHQIALTLQLRRESIAEKFSEFIKIFTQASAHIRRAITRLEETTQFHHASVASTGAHLTNGYSKALLATQHNTDLLWHERIKRSFIVIQSAQSTTLAHCEQIITLNNPLRLLQHGYSILKNGGKLVKHTEDVTIGDSIQVLVADGIIHSKVTDTKRTKHTT